MLKSKSVAVGGGCVEAALSSYPKNFAIAKFAESLLIIPKTLSVNAAMDSADLVAFHNSSQTTKVSTLDFEEEDST